MFSPCLLVGVICLQHCCKNKFCWCWFMVVYLCNKTQQAMTTYKFINFKRDYETTNVKFIQVTDNEVLNPEFWQVCDESEIDCNQLWKEDNKIMFGYL